MSHKNEQLSSISTFGDGDKTVTDAASSKDGCDSVSTAPKADAMAVRDTEENTETFGAYTAIESIKQDAANGIHKKMPRSQRKRLMKEQRLANRKVKKQKMQQSEIRSSLAPSLDSAVPERNTASSKHPENGYVSKKIRLLQAKERCREALKSGQRICVDFSLESHMNAIECSKLAQQLCRLYGSNKRAEKPMHVYFTGIDKEGELYKECVRKNAGFEGYIVDMREEAHRTFCTRGHCVFNSRFSQRARDC